MTDKKRMLEETRTVCICDNTEKGIVRAEGTVKGRESTPTILV